jgi:hypothetical protein
MNINESPRTDVLDDDGAPQAAAQKQAVPAPPVPNDQAQAPSPAQMPVTRDSGNAARPGA